MVGDRDIKYSFEELFVELGTTLNPSTASYHPHTDGHTEILNKNIIEQPLRAFCYDQTQWLHYLPWSRPRANTFRLKRCMGFTRPAPGWTWSTRLLTLGSPLWTLSQI